MRLLCNGVALDLLSGAALSFKKSNPLFAFDALTCERTQSFDIPATPHNERVMQLAKLPAFRGEGMRRRFDAELQDGTVVKRGYLYVDTYNKDRYKAMFVTGELIGLQAIKELGKLDDITRNAEVVKYGGILYNPNQGLSRIWENIYYLRKGGACHPSILVKTVSERVTQQNGLRPVVLPDAANGLRIIVGELGLMRKADVQVDRSGSRGWEEEEQYKFDGNTIEIRGLETDASGLFAIDKSGTQTYVKHDITLPVRMTRTYYVTPLQLKVLQPMRLTFPSNWPADMYVGRFEGNGIFTFYGERSFTKNYDFEHSQPVTYRDGAPLAGRTIELEYGAVFTIVQESDQPDWTQWTNVETPAHNWERDWKAENRLQAQFEADGDGDITDGVMLRMQDNLPDITYVQLLKAIAAVTGTVLNYTDADGVTFDTLDIDTWPMLNITDQVIDESELVRKFSDYAQRNIVRFDSGDLPVAPLITEYTIDNDNIAAENDLQVVPFSEGGQQMNSDGIEVLYVFADDKAEMDKSVFADSGAAVSLMRVRLPKNAGLQTLCDASTSVNIKVRMTLAQYERMSAKTTILYRGTRYVWTEATWSKEVATLKLSKIL